MAEVMADTLINLDRSVVSKTRNQLCITLSTGTQTSLKWEESRLCPHRGGASVIAAQR